MDTAIRQHGAFCRAALLLAWLNAISARSSRLWSDSRARFACIAWVAALLAALAIVPAQAQPHNPELKLGEKIGSVSGLPLPRFVSLKADRVNLREGPSREHRTTWVFQRAGLPVEITAEFDVWRKVRDSEGTEGWVLHSLLSGRRTALVAPWKKGDVFTLYAAPSKHATPVAKLQSGVIASIKSCDGHWCHVSGEGFEGYIGQTSLWGVYPNEKID
jgi:SH3-like domain-containing protein